MSKRVEQFAKRYTKKLTVFDTADYKLPVVDDRYRPLLSPIVITAVLDRVSIQLENKTGHSLDIRRYYKCVEY
jgi:fructoselysine-6-phosphate deglycase